MNIFVGKDYFDKHPELADDYFVVTYYLKGKKSLSDAAWNLAIGQSVGNPNVRNKWETEQLFDWYSAKILEDKQELDTPSFLKEPSYNYRDYFEGKVKIAFPLVNLNFDTDGISQLLCMIAGGQADIDNIDRCSVEDIQFPEWFRLKYALYGRFGISGMHDVQEGAFPYSIIDENVNAEKPFLGGIIKPKTGITPDVLLKMTKELVEGGVNFIKEDEILGNPMFCPLETRVRVISEYLSDKAVVYCFCINGDADQAIEKYNTVHQISRECGYDLAGVHLNVWAGLGTFRRLASQLSKYSFDDRLFVHFQKSGDRFFTHPSNPFHITWKVICQLTVYLGIDSIHAGMWGGYKSDSEAELTDIIKTLTNWNIVPALSCGMHPGLIGAINKRFGVKYMANCGGSIHGHPMGSLAGAKAMKDAIDGNLDSEEYKVAIEKWGKVD